MNRDTCSSEVQVIVARAINCLWFKKVYSIKKVDHKNVQPLSEIFTMLGILVVQSLPLLLSTLKRNSLSHSSDYQGCLCNKQ